MCSAASLWFLLCLLTPTDVAKPKHGLKDDETLIIIYGFIAIQVKLHITHSYLIHDFYDIMV